MIQTYNTVAEASQLGTLLRQLNAEQNGAKCAVFAELRMYVWRGAEVYALIKDGQPVSVYCGNYGKRKKNIFEPYANWYWSFTLPNERRKGHATKLYRHAEATAVERGCRRVRSLAGSAAGACLHMHVGHQFWGQKDTGELFLDTPLPGYAELYKDELGWRRPPLVPESEPWTYDKVRSVIQHGLRYDK